MDIRELELLMKEYGLAIRAIPMRLRTVVELRHADEFPNAKPMYLEEFKREMLVEEYTPKNAGKFYIECARHTGATVRFRRKPFDTIEEAVLAFLKEVETRPEAHTGAPEQGDSR